MAKFHQAVREAAARLGGDPVSLDTWANTVRRCDQLLAGTDPAMRSAAALVSVLTTEEAHPQSRGLIIALDHEPGHPMSAGDRQELRVVALYATRAATREADPSQKLLLAGIERRLLGGSPARGSFEASLRGWSHAVAEASETMDPEAALAVSRIQRTLLDAGVEAMKRLEVTDGVGHERLLAAVEASRDAWARAHDAWLEIVPRQALYIEGLDRATVGVQLAARDADNADKLTGLLATGFGGNLAAALAVTPADMRVDSDLVAVAVTLERRSDLAAVIRPRAVREREPVAVPARASVGPAVRFTTSTEAVPAPPRLSVRGVEVEKVEFGDHARLEVLARVRDAGVIAGAARAGVGDAVALVGGVSAAELGRLVERGEGARAAIAEAAVPIVHHWSRRFDSRDVRQEFVSVASVRVAELAGRWDPSRARWTTFAYSEVGFAFRSEARRLASVRETASDDVGRLVGQSPERSTIPVPRSPDEQVLSGLERERVAGLLDGLPDRLRVAMEGRLGLSGTRKTFAGLGQEMGSSRSTAARDAAEGARLLREHHLAARGAGDTPMSARASVTLRLLAQVLQQSGKGPSGASVVMRAEHRSGGPAAGVRGVSR